MVSDDALEYLDLFGSLQPQESKEQGKLKPPAVAPEPAPVEPAALLPKKKKAENKPLDVAAVNAPWATCRQHKYLPSAPVSAAPAAVALPHGQRRKRR